MTAMAIRESINDLFCDEVTCAVCGHTGQSRLPSIGHWQAEGPGGLHNRPPEPMFFHLRPHNGPRHARDVAFALHWMLLHGRGCRRGGTSSAVKLTMLGAIDPMFPEDCLHFLLQ